MVKKRHDILFTQLETYRGYLLDVVADVTEEEANIIPSGFNNNIRWNLGHVYLDQYLWIEAVTREKIDYPGAFLRWFNFKTSPSDFTAETPTVAQLKKLLEQQPAWIKEAYGHRLEEEMAPTEMGMCTIEHVLSRTIFHEGMHLQAIIDLKKLVISS